MMKIKFNKFERIAGVFVICAFVGVLVTAFSAAIKQGWFEPKIHFFATFQNADGVHQGTIVQMSGLRAGAVDSVELENDNKIRIGFHVLGKFQNRIRQNSVVQLIRPFIIGERVLDLSVGNDELPIVPDMSLVASVEGMDLMTLVSGKTLNSYLEKLSGILQNMEMLFEAFTDKNRAKSIVHVFDQIDPIMKSLSGMLPDVAKITKQVSQNDNIPKLMGNLTLLTTEINRILPELNRQNPDLAKDLAVLTQNLTVITKAVGPAVKNIETELPGASVRLVQALDQTVIVLKAMQKSLFMRGSVQEVKDEEKLDRKPASK